MGSGSSRVITLSPAAQNRRLTSDLVKLLRSQLGRCIYIQQIPHLYQATFDKTFCPADYGLCTLPELIRRISPNAIITSEYGGLTLPTRKPTEEERARTLQFAAQAIELLCFTPNLRMEFARFVPAYHAHFGRQLRVAQYGCVKLIELFELIPDAVTVKMAANDDKIILLASKPARAVIGQRLTSISPVTLASLPAVYATQYGAPPLPDTLEANSIEELVLAAGGYVENNIVRGPGDAPRWVSAALMACSVLTSDRSVTARGSTEDFFNTAFRQRFGSAPNIRHFVSSGVITCADGRVQLSHVWRSVWRVAVILSNSKVPLTPMEIFTQYTNKYEPIFPIDDTGENYF